MKWTGWIVGVVLGSVALAPAAAAAGGDSAVGGGTNGFFQIGVSAHSGPNGEDPSGFVAARSRPNGDFPVTGEFPVPFRFGGHVTCLIVHGKMASIKYRFDHSSDPTMVGGGIQIFIRDNGPPQNGETADETAFLAPEPPLLFSGDGDIPGDGDLCAPPESGAYMRGETGNFVVHDEP